ncbi:hypothetical protein SAMN05660831_02064 [Thiohalospira halophila DSM 15071]|uniref:Uncharacterized protein n=1 Tax=Thiohalospira halophila DSM 15071 TaxID=1123397 RepID=A0A1I1U8D5_9GAMM|nr:hypothetical protein [Thiohalospira halophila]SFD67039.1 hypothetical protein SAMN05660831_02064 [Thiohalospira halophila DSM 15071]
MKLKATLTNIAINGSIAGLVGASYWGGQEWAGNIAAVIVWALIPMMILSGFSFAEKPPKEEEKAHRWVYFPASIGAGATLAVAGWTVAGVAYLLSLLWINIAAKAGEAQACRNS